MKNLVYILALLALGAGCTKKEEAPQLPPVTHHGANTFGCKINGEVFSVSGKSYLGHPDGVVANIGQSYWFIQGKLNNTSVNLHFVVGSTNSLPSSFVTNGTYPGISYYFRFTDGTMPGTDNQYQTDSLRTGSIYISDLTSNFVSGSFNLDVINGNGDIVHITEGRFDISF